MNLQEFYLNQSLDHECFKLPEKDKKYLLKDNFLSEYFSERDKAQVRSNLGITSLLDELKSFISAKLFDEEGNVTFDLEPHEDAFDKVLSSAVIYNTLLKYYTKEQLDGWMLNLEERINILREQLEITVDKELDANSTNPVLNKAIVLSLSELNAAYNRLNILKADREELLNYNTIDEINVLLEDLRRSFKTYEFSQDGNLLKVSVDGGTSTTIYTPTLTKGDKGDAFTYNDFTPEQLASLKGADGANGANGADGKSAYELYRETVVEREAQPAIYSFESFNNADKEVKYGEGRVKVIEMRASGATVEVIENTPTNPNADNFVGQQFNVATALATNEPIQLYTLENEPVDIWVTVELVSEAQEAVVAMTQSEWLDSLKGADGQDGAQGPKGDKGDKGVIGRDGKSAYELYLETVTESNAIYTFESFDKTGETAYGTGKVEVIELRADGAKVKVLENSIEGFVGNIYNVNTLDESALIELYSEEGLDQNIAVRVALETPAVKAMTQSEWLASLKGADGQDGAQGPKGDKGDTGETGPQGEQGPKGDTGEKGADGTMSFEDLTDEQRESLVGETGPAGKSAYQSYLDTTVDNPKLTEIEWIASLHGQDGQPGQDGSTGPQGPAGQNGNDGITPHIDPTTKHWMIGETDTFIIAEGADGNDGANGTNGITPHIDPTTGNWFIGNTDTNVHAQGPQGIQGETGPAGQNGTTPHIDETTGNWFIGPDDTGVHAQGPQGIQGIQGILGPKGNDGLTTQITVNGTTYTLLSGNITLPDYPVVYEWAKASSKPTYTASEVGAIPTNEKGAVNGVASLDDSGKVPQSQLPSYVDDVLEYDNRDSFPETGESGKIYVDKSSNTSWRWSGSTYTQIKGDLAIGTTSGTAADGGIANTHYNNTSNPHGVTKEQVGLGNVVNTGDSATPTEGGTTKFTTGGAYTELAKKVDKVSGKGLSTNDYTNDDRDKLAGIAAGADVNVQSDWNATSGDAFIKNKPTIPDSFQWFGTSSTAAATVEKEVSIPSITSLKTGQIIVVKPTVTSTVAKSTLKLNDFDAYPMRYNNDAITTSTDSIVWAANIPSLFVFDGSYWEFLGHGLDSNTSYSTMSVAEGTAGTATSARTMRADYLKQIIQAIASEVMSISVKSVTGNMSSSCSITGSGNTGKVQTIIYKNNGSADYTVTVPTTYKTPDGAAIELTCPVGGYCEVSYLNISGTIYARGL